MSARTVPFLDLGAINARHEPAFAVALQRVLRSGRVLLGPETEAFEHDFAGLCNSPHAIGVSNGLDALHLVLKAWGLGPGDEVIVPSHTFIATWVGVSLTGATPVPVDVGERTCNLDPDRVAAAVTPHTRALIAVHLYGRPAPMDALMALAHQHGFKVLEDAAQAHGARLNGRPTGSLGHAAAFSFYPGKNLGALGDGGAITTADPALARQLRQLRNYGSEVKYVHEMAGMNARLDELQAAFLREKLPHLQADNARRQALAQLYRQGLTDVPGLALPVPDDDAHESVWHLHVVRHARRDELAQALQAAGVGVLVHYPTPPHRQGAYAHHPVAQAHLPVADMLASQELSLPMGPTLSDDDVRWVCQQVRKACAELH